MVRARVEIDKKLIRLKRIQKTKTLPIRPQSIRKLVTPFRIELKNRYDSLKDEEPSIEKMNTVLREAMDTIQNQTQKYTTKKSIEDTEIENLDKKRKELRPNKTKQNKTKQNKTKQNKTKQNTKRQGRICRTQQISEKETQNKSTEEKKRINTGNTGSKKRSKTDQ